MKRKKLLFMGTIMLCLLSGCGNPGGQSTDGSMEAMPENSAEREPSQGSSMATVPSQENSAEPEQPTENSVEPSEEETNFPEAIEPGLNEAELNDEEVRFFTDYIQEKENYGFLLSDYDKPEDVNIGEVLYSGAGFGEQIPDEEIPLYLAAAEQEELYTDCLKMPRQDIEEFLQRKMGIGLEDLSSPLEMLYLAETESYYNQAGDTNYAPFLCVEGTRQGNTYTLYFTPAADWLEGFGDRETVMVKTEDGYRFLSNHIVTQ